MRFGRRSLLGAFAGAAALSFTVGGGAAGAGSLSATARAARRLLPSHWTQFTFQDVPKQDGADVFRVSGREGRIVVAGSTPGAQLAGLRWYLKHVARANITWAGHQLRLPERLPGVADPVARRANVPHRFVFNDTNDGYTGAYEDWDYWQRELDVVALHGYNEVLVTMGADVVYHRALQAFGYDDAELRAWIPGPAHQPWWLLQNLSVFGGPSSAHLLWQRAELGRRIAERVRELGMTPVFPGYFGTVPPGFADRNPGAEVVPQGDWMGFARPDWLDPRGEHFARVAAEFYRVQGELFGDSTMYKMDLLHEGGRPGDVPVGEAAKGVERALHTARPDAVWAILGWQSNPPKAIIDAVDRSRMLIVDGLSDRRPTIVDRERDWSGTPYAFGSIWNFGGHTSLGANTPDWAELYEKWRTKEGSALKGIALMPEGADNNPAAFELFSELAWTEGGIDLEAWFEEWATSRYGERDAQAVAAWDALRRSAYGTTRADSWSESADGLFGARPGTAVRSAASWSPKALRYPSQDLDPALTALLAVRSGLRDSSAYRRDVLDVARQAVSNRSRLLLPQIRAAYEAKDRALLADLADVWLDLTDHLERLVATDATHLLGRWAADARAWGSTREEQDRLAYDNLSLVTVWGERAAANDGGLRDYANREWSGLVGGLYRLRWKTYFERLDAALKSGGELEPVDWFALEDAWIRDPGRLLTQPKGRTEREAERVHARLARDPYAVEVSAEGDARTIGRDAPLTLTVALTNRNGFATVDAASAELRLPDGLSAEPLSEPEGPLAPGGTARWTWRVRLTGEPQGLTVELRAATAWELEGEEGRATAAVRVLAADGVTAPYATVSFNDASFAQAGDRLGIEGAGRDMWGGTLEFGAVHLPGALGAGGVAEATVVSQTDTGPWARAGLVVRDALAKDGSAGFVSLALTPGNGVVLSWDANDDGRPETFVKTASVTAPVRLRLTRRGTAYTGEFSTDGGTVWTEVGEARVTAAADRQDVGVFMTATNGGSGARGIAEFDRFAVEDPE